MRKLWPIIPGVILVFLLAACDDENGGKPDNGTDTTQVEVVKIDRFYFHELDPVVEATIDQENRLITASVPRSANIGNLAYKAEFTEGATISPPSGFAYNFENPLEFTLRKGAQSIKYSATIAYSAVSDNNLLSVFFPDFMREGEVNGENVSLTVPFGTNLSEALIEMEISDFATSEPASGTVVDISEPKDIIVTAENGDQKTYTLSVTVQEQEVGIRAFWIPDPSHSPFLASYEGIQEGVALAKELNFNTLYAVAWAKTRTLYPSQVLADHSSYTTAREGMFSPNYGGGTGDPLADLIEVAHAEGLKVILWYEYGFMARWGTAPTPQNDKILEINPHWAGQGINDFGSDTVPSNYNNTDFYYNAYHPEVQQFMLDLIMEAVDNYNIDGVQGDDRLPAMPRNSGYDYYTVQRYKDEHGGQSPPNSPSNTNWVRWRVNILNQFGLDLFNTVKAAKPDILVTNSPNPYPWAFSNLMQEWPVWLDNGAVEVLSVQCYRYNIAAYRATLNEVLGYFTSHGDGNLQRLVPGIILYGSAGLTDPDLVFQKMMYNRSVGLTGESFFYDVPINDERIKKVLRAMYPGPAIFPSFE